MLCVHLKLHLCLLSRGYKHNCSLYTVKWCVNAQREFWSSFSEYVHVYNRLLAVCCHITAGYYQSTMLSLRVSLKMLLMVIAVSVSEQQLAAYLCSSLSNILAITSEGWLQNVLQTVFGSVSYITAGPWLEGTVPGRLIDRTRQWARRWHNKPLIGATLISTPYFSCSHYC